jgi:hypothetical protein
MTGSIERKSAIHGGDGLSYETALHIHGAYTASLSETEKGWVFAKYWVGTVPIRLQEEFSRKTHHWTERRGRTVFDLVSTTLPSGQSYTNYFDVTNYRYFWPAVAATNPHK